MTTPAALVLAGVLLVANSFFVGAEFAVMSVRRSQVEPLVEAGTRGAKTTMYAIEHVSLMLAAVQLGITVCSTGLGAVAEPALAGLVQAPLVGLGLPAQTAHVFGFVTALIIVIFLHVVLGEMVPKNLAVAAHTRAALWFAPPLVWFAQVIKPLIVMLNWMANIILRMCGVEPKTEVSSTFTAEEVAAIVARSQAEGVLHDEVGLISGALEFSNIKARDVMVGIDDVVCLPSGVNVADVEDAVAQYGFSRFPVCEENQKITGYLHVKDTLYARSELDRLLPVPAWRVRSIPSAQVDDDLETVLAVMQSSGTHLALVFQIGSHGPVGMVFLEDILEELVGEVRDSMQRN